ncbi:MAG: hypothetical protein RL483_1245 [Pseudomonadota bacterium]|jgi:hypothetical protein
MRLLLTRIKTLMATRQRRQSAKDSAAGLDDLEVKPYFAPF